MDSSPKRSELTPYALELVHHKARQLIGKAGYTSADLDDLKQDLIVDLLERLPKFDPTKGTYNTFVARVIERKLSNLLRDRQAEMRDRRREVCSLNEEIDTGEDDPQQRHTTMSQDEQNLRTEKYGRSAEELAHLRLDLGAVLAKLPPDLRQVADMLATHSLPEISRQLGIPLYTLRTNHLARLREVFTAQGLDDYLQ